MSRTGFNKHDIARNACQLFGLQAHQHRFWGWKRIRVDWGGPFYVEADDCFLADELFRHAEAFEMFWHAEGMKSEYEGEVVWNG